MTDIVERLRGLVATCGCGACEDAADEIERLRKQLVNVIGDASEQIDHLQRQLVKSAATIERLRDDLRRILLTDKEQ